MTEIKIPFTKVEVKKYSGSNKPANAEGLELKIRPIFFNELYEELPLDSCLNKIELAFFDGAETAIFNDLLDDYKDEFELSFEKEKVNFYMAGKTEEPDDTKIGIVYFAKDGNDSLKIIFKPQFSGVVKITSTSQGPTGPQDAPNNQGKVAELQVKISELEEKLRKQPNQTEEEKIKKLKEELNREKEISSLQSQIDSLEQKQSQNPNSGDSEQTKQELARLKSELIVLKAKQNQQSDKNPQPNDFP